MCSWEFKAFSQMSPWDSRFYASLQEKAGSLLVVEIQPNGPRIQERVKPIWGNSHRLSHPNFYKMSHTVKQKF